MRALLDAAVDPADPPDSQSTSGPLDWLAGESAARDPREPAGDDSWAAAPPASTSDCGAPAGSGSSARSRGSAGIRSWIGRHADRVRIDPGPRAVLAVAVAAVLAALVAGAWVLSARPSAVPVSGAAALDASSADTVIPPGGRSSAPPRPSTTPSGSAGAGPSVVVDVAGRVRRPGVYSLRSGSRIVDALRAAGGALPGTQLTSLNLAARLTDGQQVLVGATGGVGAGTALPSVGGPSGAGGSTGSPAPASVNLNTATAEQLQTLPGVGPVLAQHIVDWRTQHGGFTTVDQLREVSGIGDVKFAAIQPLVVV